MEVEQNTMNLSGKNVFYLSYGRGLQRSFILLHDSKNDSSSWSGIDALRKLGQWGFNVYAPDYPGFGKSEYNPKYNFGSNPAAGARFIKDFSDAVYAGLTYIIAPSVSAGSALKALIDYPENIEAVIIIGGLGVDHILKELNKINKPVLILWGGNDSVVPINHGMRYHDLIASSQFIKIDGAGHCVHLDKPDIFFNTLKKYLSEI
ncbi:alpha/beta fold hydrolase [Acidiplasma aeolicum]|uniref:Alpha/beta hydrolase n=1 Tax=Acidiplasma aeolicum TaxID=507754 RepID=A0A0Q0VSC9_9ARCH|nr:alpha/beta hydrolase [Acidiplasma aeolicum]KQB34273.1 alpha/beta hydrolase [Acidiplasma aeolicum]